MKSNSDSSTMPAVLKLPYLRRSEDIDKPPLLVLVLDGPSFLAAHLRDDLSNNPLYSTSTANMTTSVHRAATKTADIRWPTTPPPKSRSKKAPDGVLLQLPGADWIPANSFLKPSTSMDRPRKFRLPHYSHNMKWQKRSSGYWCTTSTVKGPIATYAPPTDDLPGRLAVYETLQDEHDSEPLLVHRGVSILLLDYLLISCLLLVTDAQECLAQFSGPGSLSCTSSNTDIVWKQIAPGQFLFRNNQDTTAPADPDTNQEPVTPSLSSQEQVIEIARDGPHASTSRLSLSSQFNNGNDADSGVDTPKTGTAPRADDSLVDVVDPLSNPSHHTSCKSDPPSSLSSSCDADGGTSPGPSPHLTTHVRESPCPSPCEISKAKRHAHTESESSSSAGPSSDASSLWQRRSSVSTTTSLSRSISRSRPLPRAPDTPPPGSRNEPRSIVIRRSHSHSRLNHSVESAWSLTDDVPPLPPLPATMTTFRPTSSSGRSLPPTPYDLATNRTPRGNTTVFPTRAMTTGVDGVSLMGKNFGNEYESETGRSGNSPPPPPALEWIEANIHHHHQHHHRHRHRHQEGQQAETTRPSFDYPPPPYTPIDFHAQNPG